MFSLKHLLLVPSVGFFSLAQGKCKAIQSLELTLNGAQVTSIQAEEAFNATIPMPLPTDSLQFCNVSIVLTHTDSNDAVTINVWLPPMERWTGRFQATGGSGWSTGMGDAALAPAVAAGNVAAQTDGGNTGQGPLFNPEIFSHEKGLNWGLVKNFSYRSSHDMAVVAKEVIRAYYGKDASYSYWTGCSTGGRQGMSQAQMHPEDFDGILAASPAINLPSVVMAVQWPFTVMVQENYTLNHCEFDAFTHTSIAHCDGLDGVQDGVISNLRDCVFDPFSLVGQDVNCDGGKIKITKSAAQVYHQIFHGPSTTSGLPLWYAMATGTSNNGAYPGAVAVTTNETTEVAPPLLSSEYIRYFLKKDPSYNVSSITYSDFMAFFAQSNAEYQQYLGCNDPVLTRFNASGAKLISWHGLSDNIIPPRGSIDYRERVNLAMGGNSVVDNYYRLYLAPGVNHCEGGYGPMPVDPFSALIDWVEGGKPPDTLEAQYTNVEGELVQRNLCRYPLVSRYNGVGNVNSASSYICATSFLD